MTTPKRPRTSGEGSKFKAGGHPGKPVLRGKRGSHKALGPYPGGTTPGGDDNPDGLE